MKRNLSITLLVILLWSVQALSATSKGKTTTPSIPCFEVNTLKGAYSECTRMVLVCNLWGFVHCTKSTGGGGQTGESGYEYIDRVCGQNVWQSEYCRARPARSLNDCAAAESIHDCSTSPYNPCQSGECQELVTSVQHKSNTYDLHWNCDCDFQWGIRTQYEY